MTERIIKLNNDEVVTLIPTELKFKKAEDKKFTVSKSKSEMFRLLYDAGLEIADIAREMESHYSFVYGVISSTRELRDTKKESKSDIIREMANQGMTPGEIAKQLNSNYSYVHTVVSKYKKSLEVVEAAN